MVLLLCRVEVSNLGRSFKGVTAAAGVTATVSAGEILALVGASGGGKSTTLRMLSGLLRPDAGEGRVLGLDVRRARRRICAQAAFMPQRLALYPDLSVRENLRFRMGLRSLPHAATGWRETAVKFGLEAALEIPCGALSEGWARRVQLAATLLGAPPLVLLDEPTAGLDPVSRAQMWDHIAAAARDGAAVVLSTHDIGEAETCTQVIVLMNGRVAAQGKPRTVINWHPGCTSLSACIQSIAQSQGGVVPSMLRGAA